MAGALVLVAAVAFGEYAQPPRPAPWLIALDCVIGLSSCLLLAALFRSLRQPQSQSRRQAVVVVAMVLPAIISPLAIPGSTAVVLATGRNQPWRWARWVALAGVLCHSLRLLWRPLPGLGFGWAVLLVVILHAALLAWGMRQRAGDQLLASLRDRARRAEEDQVHRVDEARRAERHRIAREMHDVLAHRLSLLATWAGALELRSDSDPATVAQASGVVREGAHQALADLREVIGLLRDTGEDPQSARHPQPGLADLEALVEESRSAGVRVLVEGSLEDAEPVSDGSARTVYRVVQECLTNARKHASGEPIMINFSRIDDDLVVEVRNPVPATVPAAGVPGVEPGVEPGVDQGVPGVDQGHGAGLIGLAERTSLAGGSFSHTQQGGVFAARAQVPIRYDA